MSSSVTSQNSISSTQENEDSLRQRYSIARHSSCPYSPARMAICMDFSLAYRVMPLQACLLMHETIRLLNHVSDMIGYKSHHLNLTNQTHIQ